MQIKKVKISNILSFPYLNNFDEDPGISFDTESNWNVNILIWPNWAWKSNFLLIINEIFKAWLMKDYVYKPEIIINNDEINFQNVIISNEIILKKLFKHFWQSKR